MKKNSHLQQRRLNRLGFNVLLMTVMMMGIHSLMAQTHYTADDFRWEYSSDSSSCENNGRLIYLVINKITGDTLNFVAGANPNDGGVCVMSDGTRFELGTFQFRKEGSTEDFMSSTSSTTTASFAPGVYEVKWSAQMYNVGEAVPIPIGTSTTSLVEVGSAYHPSTLNLVGQSTAESSEMYGGRPSLPGQNIGRVQFQVINANFPLHFVITDSLNATTLDTVVYEPMYSGTDAHRYDYATYYTFDNLAVGKYSLSMEDGCHRSNPLYNFDIREVRPPMLTNIYFNSNPPSYTDYNTVSFYSARLSVDADVWDYLENTYKEYLQYRVCYGDIDTSDWKPFPIYHDQIIQNNDYSYIVNYDIYDTLRSLTSYCPLYGKYLTFQYRCTIPGQEDTISLYSNILEKYYSSVSTFDSISYNQNEVIYNACGYQIPEIHKFTAKNNYNYSGNWNSYMSPTIPSSYTTAAFFTAPFKWKMIDTLTQETVKTRTTNYYWDSWDIYKSDMEALYGTISDTTIKFPVKIVVTDSKNCPVVTYPDVTMYDQTTYSVVPYRYTSYSNSQYIGEEVYYDNFRCCQSPTGFHIYEEIDNWLFNNNESGLYAMPDPNRFKYLRDGMKLKVTRSPYENKYNFTATYSFDRNDWDVEWENEDHGDVVTSVFEYNYSWGYRFGITIEGNCLPYGDYEYEFITDCNTSTGTSYYRHGKEIIERTEDLAFTAEQNCMEMYIQLTGGEFSRVKLGADINDPLQADQVWLDSHTLNTYVKVLGDSTGHDNRDYRVSDHPTIRLTKPGTYTLRMYTPDTSIYCRTEFYDTTITYESGVLYYEQTPTAFVCDAQGSTKGFVFCKVAGGMAPYTYTLYNANNDLLGTNNNGEFLNLPDVHQNDQLTLYVTDVCGWSTIDSSIVMRDFKNSIVVWYNDETGEHQTSGPSPVLKAVTKCEGTEITVNVSSINALFSYHWYNKSGSFNVYTSEAKVLIPRDAEADTYYVNVDFTECSAGFTDSIFVDVIRVPEVTITPSSTMVCPGETVQLTFSATNPNGSPTGGYVIGHEDNSVINYMNFSNLEQHEFSYTATSSNRFWVHSVSDEICTYTIPEDTVLISLRGMTSSCDVTVNTDTVCYGGNITLTAISPTLGSEYTVKWYDLPTQDNLLKEESITTNGGFSTFILNNLQADTSLYVTVVDELHCETYTGTVQRWLNMGDSTSLHMSCGESVRLFDSGGFDHEYGSNEKDTITFSSDNPSDRITLSFNNFDLIGNDKLYVYSGLTTNLDSLIATLGGNSIPSVITSNSSAMTLRFKSDLTDQANGWDAIVACSAKPAEAKAHVLDNLEVSLSVSPSLPARYGHSIDITATAQGGRGTNYQYVWQESTDNQTWTDLTVAPVIDDMNNTYTFPSLTESKYVKVTITDASGTPCPGSASEVLYLEITNIALSLTLTSATSTVCQETFAVSANVKNEGEETATGVSVKLNIPAGMILENAADTVITIGTVGAGQTISKTFNVRNETYVNTNTSKNIQAQIWSCNQGDGESVFQNWDWTRTPLENDEDELQVTIRASMDISLTPGVTVNPVSVCYGQEATLTATPIISEPTYIWYSDEALTTVVSTNDTYVVQQVTDPKTYYVLAYNAEYCPAATTVNHVTKLSYAVTDTLLMHNDTIQVGNNDHIRFYDDGGPNENCTATSYTLLFTSAEGSPLEIYFEGYQHFNASALTIYDGNTVMGTNLTSNTQITDGSSFTAHSGTMLVKFNSYDSYYNGFSAHVFTTTRPAVAKAVVSSRIGEANTITPTDAIVCYGDDAHLYATSTVDAPQTFTWYAPDLFTVVHTETIDNVGETSTYTVPNPQQEETYYVTVTGNSGCPMIPQIHNNYRMLLFDGTYEAQQTLAASDSVCIYDAGGKDGYYTANCDTKEPFYFNGPEGSRIHLHVNRLETTQDGSGNLQIYINDANGNNNWHSITPNNGAVVDTEFVSMANYLYVQFYPGCDYNSYPGLDAYVYVEMPQDSNNFAKARIQFITPSITEVNITGAGTYCYGTAATLEASVENNTDQLRYAWYDRNYNLLHEEEGVTSTYHPMVSATTTYYVNASSINQCPVLPPHYVTVLMNEASNRGVRTLAEGEAVYFYDEGGPNGNYSTYNNNDGGWVYTFKAPAGKQVRMDLHNFQGSGNENLSIYDGTPSNSQNSWGYCCTNEYLNQTIYAQSGTMTVRWQNYTSIASSEQRGWDAIVGVEDGTGHMATHQLLLDSVKVTMKTPTSPTNTSVQGLTACYGTSGNLKASTQNSTGEQKFKWYGPDLLEPIFTESLNEGETSQFPVQVLRNETYYVSVSNAENCEVLETVHNNLREILLNNYGENVSLAAADSLCIYDKGGKNGNYTSNCAWNYTYFTAPTDSKIHLHISSIQLDSEDDGYVQVNWHNANGYEESQTLHRTQSDLDFESADNWMFVGLSTGCNGGTYPGLDAYMYAITPHNDTLFKPVNVTVKAPVAPTDITTEGLTDCYGTAGYLEASAPNLSGDQKFKWYGPDLLSPIFSETVSQGSSSQLPVQVLGNKTYYVSVSNEENCEVLETVHNNERTVLLNAGGDIYLSAVDSLCLYDRGGKNGDYTADCKSYDRYFYAPSGSKIRLHITSLQMDDNNDGYVQVYWHNANGYEEYQTLYGTQSDLDFESADNWMRVYINHGCNGGSYPGLDAYLYAITPHSDTLFATANVMVKAPISPTVITTQGFTACYGADGLLEASAPSLNGDQTFKWYGPDRLEPIFTETVAEHGTSQLPVQVLRNETYYVSVSNTENCEVIEATHNNERTVLLNAGGDIYLSAVDSLCLYDRGGKNGDYTADCKSYDRYFYAPSGSKIRLHISSLQMDSENNGYISVIWYNANGQQEYQNLYGTQYDLDFESANHWMRVYIYHGCNGGSYPGLDAYMYAITPHSDTLFATANVMVKAPISPTVITTQGLTACYGADGLLEASAPSLNGDQTFKWYGPDRLEPIFTETVAEGETSQMQVQVLNAKTYYVSVSNAENCEVMEPLHNNYREVLLNEGGTTYLAAEDSVCLYDMGGRNGDYTANCNGYDRYFYGPSDSKIRLHISSLQMDSENNGYVQVAWHNANGNEESRNLYGTQSDLDFQSADNWMRVYISHGCNGGTYPGLDAYMYVITPHSDTLFATAQVNTKSPSSNMVNIQNNPICFGEDVELKASSSIAADQYYVWFEPDRITAHYDTVHTIGNQSTFTVNRPQEECTYYVAVYNDTTCPYTENIHSNEETLLFTQSNNETTITLDDETLYHIYDDGGDNSNYGSNSNSNIYFRTNAISKIKVHFDTIAMANDDARLTIYVTDPGWRSVFYMYGPKFVSDTDIIVDGRQIRITFENYSSSTAGGFEGTVSTILPFRMDELTPVPITFTTPEIATNVVVSDTLACYGTPINLKASTTGTTGDMHYVWYNENMELMHEEVGVTSTYSRLATANERFFVNAVAPGQCVILPPNYNSILLNAETTGRSYTLTEGEFIPFYDEGGQDNDYSTPVPYDNAWTYTFKAPTDKQVNVKVNRKAINNAELMVYDGTVDDYSNNYYCYDGETYTSTTGMMTFRWQTYNSMYPNPGWDIEVYVPDDHDETHRTAGGMAYCDVSLIQTNSQDRIITHNVQTCFGNPATLTASALASEAAFPQIYTWYNNERTEVLLRDTIDDGESNFTILPEQEETYYIALSGDGECPVVETIHDRYENDVWFTYNGTSEYTLNENNIIRIYDDGGPNGDYWHSGTYFNSNKYFRIETANSKIMVHFDTIALADNKAQLQVSNQQNWNTVFTIRGPMYIGDTTIVVDASNIAIYFNVDESTNTAGGFAGYVHAITPHSEDGLAEVSVSFTQPTINSNISVNNTEACFGDEAELLASSTSLSSPQVFAWFDEHYNFLELDTVTDGQSRFKSQVLGNATYYVNATTEGDCPVLPPNFGSIVLNAHTTGGSYTLDEGEYIPFYDEGGPNGNYSTRVPYDDPWTYTFRAPDTKQVTVKVNRRNTNNAELMVYDGTVDDHNNTYYCWNGDTYTSTTGMMTFKWYTNTTVYSYDGWDIQVGVMDVNDQMALRDYNLASANVSVKQPTPGLDLLVTNDTVCYGNEAHLTAHATSETQSLLGYPQYFTWYAPNGYTILLRDTVDGITKTQSEFTAPDYYQRQDQNYYVTVGNPDNCPVALAPISNVRSVSLNSSVHNRTTLLTASDAVKFYDTEDGSYYQNHNSDYTHTFQTVQGNLRVRFYETDKGGIEEGDTLYIYDAATADENAIIYKVSHMEDEEDYGTLSFVSTGKFLTFRFESETSYGADGWEALIMPVNMLADVDTAKAIVRVTSVPDVDITVVSDNICMGQTAEVSASANISYPQYYVWYNANMEELKRDTLHNAAESSSIFSLPAHYQDASYYALVYSDTVSCMINTNEIQRIYSVLPITENMSELGTVVAPSDSIRIFTPNVITADSYESFQYYFSADTGLIQIHFDELVMEGSDIGIEFVDDYLDIEFVELDDGTYHDLTVTSINNNLHIYIYRKPGDIFSFNATVTNTNAVNDNILSKFAQADVTVKMNNSTASVTTTNDTVCYGSPALLTAASSTLGYPQYYTWYNDDMSQIIYQDTISSGVSSYYIPSQQGRTTFLVNVENDTTCPIIASSPHPNLREYMMKEDMHLQNLFVGMTDSLVIYDDGGKDGDYSIDEERTVAVILETYPEATINIRIPTFVIDPNGDAGVAIFEYDEDFDGRHPDIFFRETQNSEIIYNSVNNRIVIMWFVDNNGNSAQGFELSATVQMHPENHLSKAKVEMSSSPYMNTLVLTADPQEITICQGEDVELTATSSLPDQPQYFVWYNKDFSSVLAVDTVQTGNEGHATIADLTQDTLIYVAVGTDDMCPAYPMDHKFNVQELRLTESISGDTVVLTSIDSVLFFDENGPDDNYTSEDVRWMQTFTAANPNAHVKIYFKYIELDDRDCRYDNWLAVVQGPIDFDDLMNNNFLHEPFVGYQGPLFTDIDTMTSTGNSLTVVWQSDCYKEDGRRGWEAYVFTDEGTNVGMDAFASTEVTVNPSYHYDIYDTVCASTTLYSKDEIFTNIDISTAGLIEQEQTYTTALHSCDSTYTLHLLVLEPSIVPVIQDVTCHDGSDGSIAVSDELVTNGIAPFTFTLTKEGSTVSDYGNLVAGEYLLTLSDSFNCSSSQTITITEPDVLQFNDCPTVSENYFTELGETYAIVNLTAPTYAPTGNNAEERTEGISANGHYDIGEHTITYIVTNDCGDSIGCEVHFTVAPATQNLTITSGTQNWPYDGEYHWNHTYSVLYGSDPLTADANSDGLVFTIPVTGDHLTITPSNTAKVRDYTSTPVSNDFSYTLDNSNYYNNVDKVLGELSITPVTETVTVTITGNKDTLVYDWNEHSVNGYTISTDNPLYTEEMFSKPAQDAPEATATRTVVGTTTMTLSVGDFANTSDNFSHVTFNVIPGGITILNVASPTFTVPKDTIICRVAGEIVAPISVTGDVTDEAGPCLAGNEATWTDLDTLPADNRGNRIIRREWTLNDDCNNTTKDTQNITIRPSVMTTGNITFTCPDTTVTLKYGVGDTLIELNRTLINNMSDMTIELDSTGIPDNHRYRADVNQPYIITWRITDECGDYMEYTQRVTVNFPPCGPGVTAIDGDGIAYPTIQVGNNCWTARNARSTRYANDNSPITPEPMQYPGTENHPEDTIYGKLYTYSAATHIPLMRNIPAKVQGICPNGWHIPDEDDYADLLEHWTGAELNASEHWISPGTNISGFTMEPGGRYNAELDRYEYRLARGYLCIYTPGATTIIHLCEFGYACSTVEIVPAPIGTGLSVRCVRDTE